MKNANTLLLLCTVILLFLTGIIYKLRVDLTSEMALYDSVRRTNVHLVKNIGTEPGLELIQGKGRNLLIENFQANKYTVVVLFEPSGCGVCVEENVLWTWINKNSLPVIAVVRHDDIREVPPYLRNAGISLPVFRDSNNLLFSRFSSFSLPLKILVDKQGNILNVDEVRSTDEEQKSYLRYLNYIKSR